MVITYQGLSSRDFRVPPDLSFLIQSHVLRSLRSQHKVERAHHVVIWSSRARTCHGSLRGQHVFRAFVRWGATKVLQQPACISCFEATLQLAPLATLARTTVICFVVSLGPWIAGDAPGHGQHILAPNFAEARMVDNRPPSAFVQLLAIPFQKKEDGRDFEVGDSA